jgi:hypothetical protein
LRNSKIENWADERTDAFKFTFENSDAIRQILRLNQASQILSLSIRFSRLLYPACVMWGRTMVSSAVLIWGSVALAAASRSESVKIGNNFVFAPNGISFVYQDRAAFVLDPGGEYFAGKAAPDNSYHETHFQANGTSVTFEWGRVGDGIVGRLRADRPVSVPIKLIPAWPDWHSDFVKSPMGWEGKSNASGTPTWRLLTGPSISGTDAGNLLLQIGPSAPTYVVGGFGPLPKIADVDKILNRAATRYDATAPKATGDWGDFLGPICQNLANSRIYSSDDHRVAISVSRRWADSPNSEPYFCWDSFFNGCLASLNDPITARETVRAILSWQTPEGLVPNFGHWHFGSERASNDRSQPPVGSMCVWKMNQRWPDKTFLAEAYPKLLKWHRWWPTARDGKHDGLLEWGSGAAGTPGVGKQGALWETGWDDTVEYEGAEMSGSTLNAYAVDLNSLWAMDAEYLSRIARVLGRTEDARELDKERETTVRLMNEKLWNPELGIYCSRLWSGQFLTRLTPMNFYPLIAGVPDQERAAKVLAVMKDPTRFWGKWILPTVSYSDPVWPQQDYWKGKVWAPVNYLVFQGVARYASPDAVRTLASKSVELFMRNWKAQGVCGENYLSSTGEQSSDPHYTWGALLCLAGLESVCAIQPDGSIKLDGGSGLSLSLANIPIGGKLYDLRCTPGHAQLLRKGKVVAEAADTPTTFHLY